MTQEPQAARVIRFESFEVNLRAGELWKNGQKVKLPEQSFQILTMLLERPGELVLRREIQKRLWPNDTVVEFENSINAAIKKLRLALGDSADRPRYVETLARRGYRWMLSVEWAEAGTPALRVPVPAAPSPPPASPAVSLLGKKVSHYRVLEIVGGGGMGVVYEAEDLKLGRRVALKFLPEELAGDPAALERFEREARAASALEHPNICPVYEFGEHESQPFIAMQLLEGQTLRELIATPLTPGPWPQGRGWPEGQAEGPHGTVLPIAQVLDIAIQIADGLEAAHSKRIIHRDIKPANIFITTRGEARILDFGLAKPAADSGTGILPVRMAGDPAETRGQGPVLSEAKDARATAGEAFPERSEGTSALQASDGHLTRTGVKMGTAPYMSPEQVRGEKVDVRTDLFSFGLVLYEMATGQAAFAGASVLEVHEAIVNQTPFPARDLNPDIPPRLEGIINKALQKDRRLRYQTPAELRADLEELKRDTNPGRGVERAPLASALRSRWPLVLAALALAVPALAGIAWFLKAHHDAPTDVSEREITANPPEDWVEAAAVSPDGRYVTYYDQTGLYLRSIDSGQTRGVSLPAELQKPDLTLEWFPDGGKLLAGAFSSEGFDLWMITVLGEEAPRLLYHGGMHPAISPDGRRIAFVMGDPVWVGGINGEAPRKLGEEEMSSPAWSPDGRWIAYIGWKQSVQGSWSSGWSNALEVRPAGGGPVKTVVSQASLPKSSSFCYANDIPANCLRWSPDWRLVFSVRQLADSPSGQESYGLWEVPVKPSTGEAVRKPERLARWSDFGPQDLSVTADGKRLSFLKTREWQDVYLGELGPDGASMKAPRRFTLDNRGSDPNGWTPDSEAIIFSSERSGKSDIFRQALNENMPEAIVQGPGQDYGQSGGDAPVPGARVSPGGAWILYGESPRTLPGTHASPSRLMRRPLPGGSPEMVVEEAAGMHWDYRCPLKPGSSCVLSQEEGGDFVFYSLDPWRGKGEQLGRIKAPRTGFTGWNVSPDGSRLAVVRGDDEHNGRIDVLALSNHDWDEVPVEPVWGHLQSIAWAADGRGFFVTSWQPDSFNLLHVSLAGKVSPLLRNHRQWMHNPLPSPDGKYLAFGAQTWDSNVWMLENF